MQVNPNSQQTQYVTNAYLRHLQARLASQRTQTKAATVTASGAPATLEAATPAKAQATTGVTFAQIVSKATAASNSKAAAVPAPATEPAQATTSVAAPVQAPTKIQNADSDTAVISTTTISTPVKAAPAEAAAPTAQTQASDKIESTTQQQPAGNDTYDYIAMAQAFGAAKGDKGYDARLDLNNDGVINSRDLGALLSQMGGKK